MSLYSYHFFILSFNNKLLFKYTNFFICLLYKYHFNSVNKLLGLVIYIRTIWNYIIFYGYLSLIKLMHTNIEFICSVICVLLDLFLLFIYYKRIISYEIGYYNFVSFVKNLFFVNVNFSIQFI